MDELKSKTIRGLKWSAVGVAAQVLLQTISIGVLARLLTPEEFGLLAMANVLIQFVSYFSRMGLGPALIQRPDIDEKDIRASFTMAVILGLVFTAVSYFLAPIAGVYFRNEHVVPLIRVLSFSFIFSGFSLTANNLLRRELRFKLVAAVEVISFAVGYAGVAILFAVLGYGVWSLVAGILAQQLLILLISYAFERHSLLPIFSWQTYRRSLRFGAHYSLNSILDFLYVRVDILLLGRFFNETIVGIYDRAYKLTHLPVQYLAQSVSKVMFPAFSRLQEDGKRLSNAFLKTFSIIGLITVSICAGIAPAAREIVLVVLGPQWDTAILPLQILTIAVPLHYMISVQGVLLDSMDELKARSITRVIGVLAKVGILLYTSTRGFHWFIAGISISLIVQMAISTYFVVKNAKINLGQMVASLGIIVLGGVTIAVAVFLITLLTRSMELPLVVRLVTQIAVGGLVLMADFSLMIHLKLLGLQAADFLNIPLLGKLLNWRKA